MSGRLISLTLNTLLALTSLVTLLAVSAAAQSEVTVQPEEDDQIAFPRGSQSVSCVPYMGPGYRDFPVRAYSVTSELGGGVTVTRVGVENRSSRVVRAVKLRWFLTTERDQNVTLREGQTSFLKVPNGIPPGEAQHIRYELVSFGKVYKTLARSDGGGKFLLHIAVSEARYENDSTWTLDSWQRGAAGRRAQAAYLSMPRRAAP